VWRRTLLCNPNATSLGRLESREVGLASAATLTATLTNVRKITYAYDLFTGAVTSETFSDGRVKSYHYRTDNNYLDRIEVTSGSVKEIV